MVADLGDGTRVGVEASVAGHGVDLAAQGADAIGVNAAHEPHGRPALTVLELDRRGARRGRGRGGLGGGHAARGVVGLQALPPIAWLPLAILWFGITERAVVFVVIVGAFPAIAMATASSVRHVRPVLIRAGRTLGADGWGLYREVVVPAALPGYIEGLRQGWVFAWRSLMAAELIVAGGRGLGHALDKAGSQFDAPTILALMVVIAGIGILIDAGFAAMDRHVRARRGLLVA